MILFAVSSLSARAQVLFPLIQLTGKVYGVDDYEATPYRLGGASVHAFCEGDSTIFDLRDVTDADGRTQALVQAGKFGAKHKMHIRISYVGMETFDSIFTPAATVNKMLGNTIYKVNLDSIVLHSKPVTLQEAQVISELRKMYERGDTIIFNAQAYEMPSGSVLLELVRRLPGLLYDGDELTYNGRKIEEIKLNGDKFFAHDLSIALQNMPNEKIKSLKVYEEKRDTLNANSDKRLVMDMETDKIYKDVVFINAGLTANPSPFNLDIDADANAYRRKTYNASLRYNRQTIPGRYIMCENLNRNLLTSSLRVDKWCNLSISPMFEHANIGHRTLTLSENMMPDFYNCTVSDSRTNSRDWTIGNLMPATISGKTKNGIGWNMDLNLKYKHIDDITDEQRSQYSANPYSDGLRGDMLPDDQLDSIRINSYEKASRTVGHELTFDWQGKMSRRVGSNDYGISAKVGLNDQQRKVHDESSVSYAQLQDSTSVLNRMMSQPGSTLNTGLQLFYNHTFAQQHHWGLEYDLSFRNERRETLYYDVTDETAGDAFPTSHATEGLARIDSLSYKGRSTNWMHSIGANVTFDWEHFLLRASAAAVPTFLNVTTIRTGMADSDRSFKALLYSAAFSSQYKAEGHKVSFDYRYREDTPSAFMMMDITDYSDPLNVRRGATTLSRTRKHAFDLKYEKGFAFMLDTHITIDQNTPTNKVTYDPLTGRSISTPTPVNGNWMALSNLRYTFNLFKRSFSLTASHTYHRNVNYVQQAGSTESLKGKTDYNTFHAALSHTITNKSLIVRLTTQYSLTDMANSTYNMHSTQGELKATAYASVYLPYNFDFTADASYSLRHGHQIQELNKSRCLLNLLLGYKFLKRKATVQVEWRDVFNQVRNTDIRNTAYIRTETRTFCDTSMFLATFKYKFNLFE